MSIITTTESNISAPAHFTAPKFHRWRVRRLNPNGSFSFTDYNARIPVTAEDVRTSPAVREWVGSCPIDEIYHPEP